MGVLQGSPLRQHGTAHLHRASRLLGVSCVSMYERHARLHFLATGIRGVAYSSRGAMGPHELENSRPFHKHLQPWCKHIGNQGVIALGLGQLIQVLARIQEGFAKSLLWGMSAWQWPMSRAMSLLVRSRLLAMPWAQCHLRTLLVPRMVAYRHRMSRDRVFLPEEAPHTSHERGVIQELRSMSWVCRVLLPIASTARVPSATAPLC